MLGGLNSPICCPIIVEHRRYDLRTKNANLSHGHGALNLATFEPFPKNPPISKGFREIGLADELGSGMRNTYTYTKMYSGGEPQFIEGDVFRITIPLSEMATATVGPTSTTVSPQVTTQVKLESGKLSALLEYCSTAKSRKEMQEFCGIKTTEYFRKTLLSLYLRKD